MEGGEPEAMSDRSPDRAARLRERVEEALNALPGALASVELTEETTHRAGQRLGGPKIVTAFR